MSAAVRLDDVRVMELRAGEVAIIAFAPFWRRLLWMVWPWGLRRRFRRAAKDVVPVGVRSRLLVVGRRRFERGI